MPDPIMQENCNEHPVVLIGSAKSEPRLQEASSHWNQTKQKVAAARQTWNEKRENLLREDFRGQNGLGDENPKPWVPTGRAAFIKNSTRSR